MAYIRLFKLFMMIVSLRICLQTVTKGTMESLELRPIEQAKISCAKKLFNEMSNSKVVYHDIDSYQSLLNIIEFI